VKFSTINTIVHGARTTYKNEQIQYLATQKQAAAAFGELKAQFGDKLDQLLNYMKLRSVRDHGGNLLVGVQDAVPSGKPSLN